MRSALSKFPGGGRSLREALLWLVVIALVVSTVLLWVSHLGAAL